MNRPMDCVQEVFVEIALRNLRDVAFRELGSRRVFLGAALEAVARAALHSFLLQTDEDSGSRPIEWEAIAKRSAHPTRSNSGSRPIEWEAIDVVADEMASAALESLTVTFNEITSKHGVSRLGVVVSGYELINKLREETYADLRESALSLVSSSGDETCK